MAGLLARRILFSEIRPGMPRYAAAVSLLLLSCAAQMAAWLLVSRRRP